MAGEFPQVDFSGVDPVWPDKTSPAGQRFAYTRDAILERGVRALTDLYHRPERLVIVFAHSGFLRVGVAGWWFFNSDYRIFEFGHAPSADDHGLVQDEATISGGLGLSRTTRVELGSDIPEEVPEAGQKTV